ncbi:MULTISPECIES: HD domain-containing phosphohydrolase [Vibrio]|uniref:HD domain-containing phosphohydrolase n=1 Tax=Vibrio TaxID=662 RepID=UPI002074ACF8|nr:MULTISPECIES: HD domain-containing phosphohydrolase [Vibrio]USD35105.1 HD domain-containing protein [Vibrio sp. SCSIO 43186]USD48171.1 HD domain-containing protein [Vibrio sp. SCSIO 43145]USD72230.1 HD domain-containing protein [Vibrio sp. SCSIO 43139]USD97905.1 metal-dependent phosphohydrolase [Vibrio coralliilyticus]
MKKRRYSLSIHITSLFLVLTTLVGTVLIAISYRHSQELLTVSAKELSSENSRKLESTFKVRVGPILTTLDFMALSAAIDQRQAPIKAKRFLSSLDLIFKRNQGVVALFYANEQGEFTMLRSLRDDKTRERFGAPPTTSMMINFTKPNGLNELHFLDSKHRKVGYKKTHDNEFDPRVRPWFVNADPDGDIRLTEPYFFYFLKTNGVTLSRRSADGGKVVAADFTLSSLSQQLSEIGFSDKTKLILFDNQFRVLAQHQTNVDLTQEKDQIQTQLEDSLFAPILDRHSSQTLYEPVVHDGKNWSVTLTPVVLNEHVRLLLAEATPQEDLLMNLLSMRDRQITVAMAMLALSFIVVWIVANRLATPLQNLVLLTDNIARFDFKKTRYPKSVINEVANLTESIELMEHTLHDLLRLLRETASNQDFSLLAKTITHQSYLVTRAETIILYTHSDKKNTFDMAANHAIIPFKIELNEFLTETAWLETDLRRGEIVHLNRSDNALSPHKDIFYNSDIYFFPLLNRDKQLVGILLLGYERAITKEQSDKHAFLKELLSFAEIAKENIDQMQQQKDMLNAFIELIASSIDTKSPYTGSHCQRVPELTKMLTQVAQGDDHYFPQFEMDKKQWEELHLAAWLHDCGKVTTPEYVIDKATKLETIYDRIHEIRMRFELLKTQAEVDYWQGLYNGGSATELKHTLKETHRTLDEEFQFIANCNVGSEQMEESAIERLKTIAQRQWKRTLDDQAGVSWVEKQRAGEPAVLPVMEPLLGDKPVHQIPWTQGENPQDIWKENFVLQPGKLKYNRGELYNLSIRYGTLNDEERFIVNDHIIQTITMLGRLPYPEHLKNIPEIAGGHHERMDGKGYPRGLSEEQLSIPARVMAIADVFEALTSSDRPYKKAKSLAESLNIMTHMATSGHIDPKLYLLFLEHEIDQSYAEKFLAPEQIVPVEREEHIQTVKAHLKTLF